MNTTCDCGEPLAPTADRSDCYDCGSSCCRSCQIDVDNMAYCRWCATSPRLREAA